MPNSDSPAKRSRLDPEANSHLNFLESIYRDFLHRPIVDWSKAGNTALTPKGGASDLLIKFAEINQQVKERIVNETIEVYSAAVKRIISDYLRSEGADIHVFITELHELIKKVFRTAETKQVLPADISFKVNALRQYISMSGSDLRSIMESKEMNELLDSVKTHLSKLPVLVNPWRYLIEGEVGLDQDDDIGRLSKIELAFDSKDDKGRLNLRFVIRIINILLLVDQEAPREIDETLSCDYLLKASIQYLVTVITLYHKCEMLETAIELFSISDEIKSISTGLDLALLLMKMQFTQGYFESFSAENHTAVDHFLCGYVKRVLSDESRLKTNVASDLFTLEGAPLFKKESLSEVLKRIAREVGVKALWVSRLEKELFDVTSAASRSSLMPGPSGSSVALFGASSIAAADFSTNYLEL